MMEPPSKPPVWISRPDTFARAVADLSSFSQLAVDTESNSLYVYQEQVCLIQISTPLTDYLIDPLALRDLSALGPIFSSPDIEKIFHAAEYDLICLKRDFGFSFQNIFDTMQAARILGRTEIGLASMLSSEFGLKIEKKFQRANWGERPLPAAMLAYARLDSYYLIDLRNILAPELESKKLIDLAREDFRRVCEVSIPANENDSLNCWRLIGRQDATPQQGAVLQALLMYRDRQARMSNLPHFKIFSNQVLIDIAFALPQSAAQLGELKLLSPRQLERHGNGLINAIQTGLNSPPPPRQNNHRPPDAVLNRMDSLKEWRKVTARHLGVESDIVLPRDILEGIAFNNPKCLDDLSKIMATTPWRLNQYGNQILSVLKS